MTSEIEQRKSSHLEICAREDVEHHTTTLLEEVHLFHEALPELSLEDVDLSGDFLGRPLTLPLLISGMTGGTETSLELNRALAAAAHKLGIGMGLGSQRTMLLQPELTDTYSVRHLAPRIPLLANLGAVQARSLSATRLTELIESVGADGLCIHLNAAQELVQDEGDRDFRGCLDAIARLVAELEIPIVVKETGCGLAPRTLSRIKSVGVEWVDVSGAGGTTWTGVEALRGSPRQRRLGEELRDWGIPTAAAIVYARRAGLRVIASGGIRSGLDCARAIALGAELVSFGLPFLRAFFRDGAEGVVATAAQVAESLRAVALLSGARCTADLVRAPRVLGKELSAWID